MKYVIDNRVQILQGGMSSVGVNEPEIILTAAPMRLLSYLLENPNRIVSREELYKHVWEERGLTPSGTSLSQYISVIRKSFLRYGFEDSIIENIPKEGVRFNAQVVCIKKNAKADRRGFLMLIKNTLTRLFKTVNKSLYWLIIVFFCIPVLCFIFCKNTLLPDFQYAGWVKSGYINKCEVYFPEGEMSDEVKIIYIERTTSMLKNLRINCNPNSRLLVSLHNPLNNYNRSKERPREFIAHCILLKESYYCYSYYFLHGGNL